MKYIILFFLFLVVLAFSGCTSSQDSNCEKLCETQCPFLIGMGAGIILMLCLESFINHYNEWAAGMKKYKLS